MVGAEIHELLPKKDNGLKYFGLIARTLGILLKKRPALLFVQNPSIVLSALAVFLKPLFRYVLVVDEHNAGLFPLEGRSRFFNWVARMIARKADCAVVTNERLASRLETWGANPVVMPDPLPRWESAAAKPHDIVASSFNILFICTWAEDEPFDAVLSAFDGPQNEGVELFVTGNYRKRIRASDITSDNIHLLGFVSESEYQNYLFGCDAVIVLTKREDCLNCGAYESVSAEKPGILSGHESLKNYFHKGFLFTDNTGASITSAVKELRSDYDRLHSEICALKTELGAGYTVHLEALNAVLAKKGIERNDSSSAS